MNPTITVTGRVGTIPELRFTQSGVAVCSFSVVTDRRTKNEQTGEWESHDTTWFRFTAWRQLAETITEEIDKGDAIIAEGRINLAEYETKDGQKGKSLEFLVFSLGKDLKMRKPKERQTEPQADKWSTDRPPF